MASLLIEWHTFVLQQPTNQHADVVQQLHEESLTEGRDILKTENEKEKQKWLNKSGTDWSGAFGENPKDYVGSTATKQVGSSFLSAIFSRSLEAGSMLMSSAKLDFESC